MASEKAFAGAALLGVVGGIRSMTPPAALAARGLLLRDSPARFAVLAAAAGEFAADKAPFAPPRTMPPALAGRIVSGAATASRLAGLPGAALGAAAAAAGTFGSYHARKGITELGVPGTVVALAEDGVAVAFAALATRPDPQDEEPEGESRLRRVARGVVRGTAAGLAGTAVMTGAQLALQRATGGGESRAPEQVGRRLLRRTAGKRVPRGQRDTLNQAMHWLYGTSWGVDLGLTAALAGSRPPVLAGGVGLGLTAWIAGLVQLPALGVAPPPWDQPPASLAADAALHLVFGLAVAGALKALP